MVILYFSNNFNKEEKMKRKIPVAIIGKNFGYKVLAKSLEKTKRFDLKALSLNQINLKINQ